YSNIRVGMFLEVATTIGAVVGAILMASVPVEALAVTFGAVLLYSAWLALKEPKRSAAREADALATRMKVIAMDQVMLIPFKVSTTTSNFMIGVTAAASVGIYLGKGYITPGLAMPVMLGVLAGSLVGARHLMGAKTRALRRIFAAVIAVLAMEMIYNGVAGGLKSEEHT